MRNRSKLMIAALLLVSACAATRRPPLAAQEPRQSSRLQDLFAERAGDAASSGYRIGVGDKLKVAVAQAQEISGDYAVAEDGKISLPLVGDVVAGSKTEQEVSEAITAKLKAEYLQSPEVIVSVAGFVGRKVTV